MSASNRGSSHFLVIHEKGEDYTIEHPDDCPQETFWLDPQGEPIKCHTCALGQIAHDGGLDPLENAPDSSWENLPEGRYEITAWTQHYPSTPYRYEEWDAGLELVV